MKIVVIGGSGLIGKKLVGKLRSQGHGVLAASPSNGVDTVTGAGLAEALAGAQIVVDTANSPSFADDAVMEFFQTSGRNLLAAEKAAGVKHHVAVSVVGTERLQGSGYFRAKLVQEQMVVDSGIPFTILRATQFFEFMGSIAEAGTDGQIVRLSTAMMQPIAAEDVAEALADVTLAAPVNGIVEVAGPERRGIDQFVRRYLSETKDARRAVSDPQAPYFGMTMDDRSLTPDDNARIGAIRFESWLSQAGQS